MRREKSIVRLNLQLSMGFGLAMGLLFPLYAHFFVNFRSSLHLLLFVLGCVLAGLCVGGAAFGINKVTLIRAMRLVDEELRRLHEGQGDLTRRLTLESHDQVGALVADFNSFVEQWDRVLAGMKRGLLRGRDDGAHVKNAVQATGSMLVAVGALIEESHAVNGQHKRDLSALQDALEQWNASSLILLTYVVELISQMDGLTKQLATQTEAIAEIAVAGETIERVIGREDVQTGSTTLIGVSAALEHEIEHTISTTARQEARIRDVLKRIEDLAGRSKVIAVNVGIEAVRTGTAGRRFKVLAAEVSGLSTGLAQLVTEVEQTVQETFRENRPANAEFGRYNEEYRRLRGEIVNRVGELGARNAKIDQVTHSVDATYGEVAELLREVHTNVEQLGHGSQRTRATMESLTATSVALDAVIERIRIQEAEMNGIAQAALTRAVGLIDALTGIAGEIERYKTSEQR